MGVLLTLIVFISCQEPEEPFTLPFEFTATGLSHMPQSAPEYSAVGLPGEIEIRGEFMVGRCYGEQKMKALIEGDTVVFSIRFRNVEADCHAVADVVPYTVRIIELGPGPYRVRVEHYGTEDGYFNGDTGQWVDLGDGVRLEAAVDVE